MNRREVVRLLSVAPLIFSGNCISREQLLTNGNNIKDFKIYNQLHFKKMPNLNRLWLDPITFIYGDQLWGDRKTHHTIDESYVINKYSKVKLLGNESLLCLDIEHFKTRWVGDKEFNESIAHLNHFIDIFRGIYPGVKIGIFEYAPLSFYPLYDQFAAGKINKKHYAAWKTEINRLKAVTDNVDILFPQLYSRWFNNPDGWKRCAQVVMTESREIANGKPVIPVVWPQYWLKGEPIIDGSTWAMILNTMYELADSVVFWSIYQTAPRWDPQAAWWAETRKFKKKIDRRRLNNTDNAINFGI